LRTIEKGVRTLAKGARPFLEVNGQNSRHGGEFDGVPVENSSGKRQPCSPRPLGMGTIFTGFGSVAEAFFGAEKNPMQQGAIGDETGSDRRRNRVRSGNPSGLWVENDAF
jgi:hypothetical protein